MVCRAGLKTNAGPAEADVEERCVGYGKCVVGANVHIRAASLAGKEIAVHEPILPGLRKPWLIAPAQYVMA